MRIDKRVSTPSQYRAVNRMVQEHVGQKIMLDIHVGMLRAGYRESYPGSQEFVREE
jgi:hypothetical protein